MTVKWKEMRQFGGLTHEHLFLLHTRAHSYRRKIANNTYSHAYRHALLKADMTDGRLVSDSACPECNYEPRGYDTRISDACAHCTAFGVKLHGNEIGLVTNEAVFVNIRTIGRWPTVTTYDRVNNYLLSSTSWRLRSHKGRVFAHNYASGDVFDTRHTDDDQQCNYLPILCDDSAPAVWQYFTLVQTEVVHPYIKELLPGDPTPISQIHLATMNRRDQ